MVQGAFHEKGDAYIRWAAAMAVELQTGVPWIMCKQDDAPDPVVSFVTSSEVKSIFFPLICYIKEKLSLRKKYSEGNKLIFSVRKRRSFSSS